MDQHQRPVPIQIFINEAHSKDLSQTASSETTSELEATTTDSNSDVCKEDTASCEENNITPVHIFINEAHSKDMSQTESSETTSEIEPTIDSNDDVCKEDIASCEENNIIPNVFLECEFSSNDDNECSGEKKRDKRKSKFPQKVILNLGNDQSDMLPMITESYEADIDSTEVETDTEFLVVDGQGTTSDEMQLKPPDEQNNAQETGGSLPRPNCAESNQVMGVLQTDSMNEDAYKSWNKEGNVEEEESKIAEKCDNMRNAVESLTCSCCEENFTYRAHLEKHYKTVHVGFRPYQCAVCEKTFLTIANWNVHMRNHTGERPFACKLCDSTFTMKSCLKTHMKSHTGEKPYPCTVCQRAFATTTHLKLHMTRHTGEKPHQCTTCEKRFSQASYLKRHMMLHRGEKPFPCSVCEKAFTTAYELNCHVRSHTQEKPYSCPVCLKQFNQTSSVKQHITIHTGQNRAYECSVCSKTFISASKLKTHLRVHQGSSSSVKKLLGKSSQVHQG